MKGRLQKPRFIYIMMKVTVDAAAKINLFLDITGTLENGYHSLFMVMQSVDLFDTVTLEKTETGIIELTCSEPSLPCDRKNIAMRAAQAFFNDADIKNTGLRIHIEKKIPLAAGLAGGSADAAAVICGLNALYEAGLCETALCSIGIKVGSDVPFCIAGGTRLVENIGEKMSFLPALRDCHIVLAKPERGVSTAEAYAAYNELENVNHPDGEAMLSAARASDFEKMCEYAQNVFEQVIDFPEFSSIRSCFESNGASLVRMSGSGPTMFGIFTDDSSAQTAAAQLKSLKLNCRIHHCRPISDAIRIKA